MLTYLHLAGEDLENLESLAAEGVNVAARDLPDAHRVSLDTLLGL